MRINSGNSIRLIKWKLIGYNILMIYNLYRCSLNVYIYLFIYRKFLLVFCISHACIVYQFNVDIYIWGVEIKEEVLKKSKNQKTLLAIIKREEIKVFLRYFEDGVRI